MAHLDDSVARLRKGFGGVWACPTRFGWVRPPKKRGPAHAIQLRSLSYRWGDACRGRLLTTAIHPWRTSTIAWRGYERVSDWITSACLRFFSAAKPPKSAMLKHQTRPRR